MRYVVFLCEIYRYLYIRVQRAGMAWGEVGWIPHGFVSILDMRYLFAPTSLSLSHRANTGQPQGQYNTLYRALFGTLLCKYLILYIEYWILYVKYSILYPTYSILTSKHILLTLSKRVWAAIFERYSPFFELEVGLGVTNPYENDIKIDKYWLLGISIKPFIY